MFTRCRRVLHLRRYLLGRLGGSIAGLLHCLGGLGQFYQRGLVHHVTPGVTGPGGSATSRAGLLGNGALALIDSSTQASNLV